MSERLFGTDGVRGRAGSPPLDPPTIRRLGAALVRALPRASDAHSLLIGRDTRESGEWIGRELAHGARTAGGVVTSAGVISTPAVAHLTREGLYDAGVVISASHNPFEDNGIKVFSGAGEKFTERLELEIEQVVADPSWNVADGDAPGLERRRSVRPVPGPRARSAARRAGALAGCAWPWTAPTARRAPWPRACSRSSGSTSSRSGAPPTGGTSTLGAGPPIPGRWPKRVVARGCRLGIAFDGDGDRAIFVDHLGRIVDGDAIMLLAARHLQATGRLKNNAIVATVMSNIGLEIALRESGIDLVRCPVGDKYVMEAMIARDIALGGEQSGHIIFSDFLFTGDGLVTALNVLQVMAATGRELADLAGELTTYPQILLNVRVRARRDLRDVPPVAAAIADVERRLGGDGRLLVRYSGTEPLLRIMLEGQDQDQIRAWAEEIAAEVRTHLA